MMRILTGIVAILAIGILVFIGVYSGYTYGRDQGYSQGYIHGAIDGAGSGYNLRNPTYDEALDFMERDQTNKREYHEAAYTCSDFATEFNNNAEAEGLRCAYVYIEYIDSFGHSIVAFDTVDRGMIFIEPQFDKVVTLEEGMRYSQENGFKEPSYDDTVRRFTIAW